MAIKKFCLILVVSLVTVISGAQINIFVGGNFQALYTGIRADESTYQPGFGAGFSFVYWEYEYWFLKAGLDYNSRSSECLHFPEDYGIPITDPDDAVNITFYEQTIGLPLTIYFRPIEKGANSLLLTGTLEMQFIARLKENSVEYGEILLTGTQIKNRTKTNVGFGVGYQRLFDKHIYLNIVPSFNVDIRAERPFNTIKLTAELIFGVY